MDLSPLLFSILIVGRDLLASTVRPEAAAGIDWEQLQEGLTVKIPQPGRRPLDLNHEALELVHLDHSCVS